MNDLVLSVRQAAYFGKSYIRNPQAMIFTVLFPIVLLVLFSEIFGGHNARTVFDGVQVNFATYFTPGIVAYAITMAGFSSLAIVLTQDREAGILKRFRGTPLPAWVFILAQILKTIAVIVVMTVALLVIAYFAFDVNVRSETLVGLVVYLVLGTVVMCSLGIALTSVVTSGESAAAIAPFSTVILSFISGVFVPAAELPNWLVTVGKVFPLAQLADGLQRAFSPYTAGTGLRLSNVLILVAWGVGGMVVAAMRFKWEPRAAGR